MYQIIDPIVANQPITENSTTKQHPLGTIARAKDDGAVVAGLGAGEFIYLNGLAATAVGETVIYDQFAGTTKRAVAGDRGPAAFAMSANLLGQFGWYQIAGAVVAKTGTVAAGGAVYLTATPGSLDDAVVATDKMDGARFKTADGTPSAGFAIIECDRPVLNGNG